jgi:hypothetical protein
VHAYAQARQKEQRPRHSITVTLHPLNQIQKTWIYAEIFGPNLAAKLFYRSPLGVMHCSLWQIENTFSISAFTPSVKTLGADFNFCTNRNASFGLNINPDS